VLDAGPLIALLYAGDREHSVARAGFGLLAASRARMITPLPIVFEVYKWVLYETNQDRARRALKLMRDSLEVRYPTTQDLEELSELVAGIARWRGTLEDALVALTGLHLRIPIWTFNYRDLAAFPRLTFWTPAVG
jgi:predicted nucleic acid-binding protein